MADKSSKGNQIHIVITQDFSKTAEEFFRFCRDNGYNASKVIRDSIARWLFEQKEMRKELSRINTGKRAMKKTREIYERSVLYDR